MKLSDKALRQIGRELLEGTDTPPHQDDSPNPGKPGVTPARGLRLQPFRRSRSATVLPFKKRLRWF